MSSILLPAIWLIVLLVGLPQLSETVYTPSLPDIARALLTKEAMVEYTLTIYLFGFALGTLFWGNLSDKLGRKPCVLAGLFIFILGCMGCYFAQSIDMLMISRFIQALGGSIGSVLGQAICRDAFHGPALGKVYATTGSALALFPALGPLCGGLIAEVFGWRHIFVVLILFATLLSFLITIRLPETYPRTFRKHTPIWTTARQLSTDQQVVSLGLIVGGCNGILFSYFAEGPFYLIKGLHLSPSHYGLSFVAIALSTMAGGMLSKKLHDRHESKDIMGYGLMIVGVATTLFSMIACIHHYLWALPDNMMIILTLIAQMGCALGICMATSNALALALVHYKHAIGTASSLFGFFYYCLIALFTFFMGLLHDGTLLPMPIYFLSLSYAMMIVHHIYIKK